MNIIITSELIKQSIDYIMQHIDEEISIEDVANYCNYSKYYFSRVFKAETGESTYAFIKRLKMERSALRLKLEKDKSITDIGVSYGYSSSNYSSAFKKHHNISPAEFRKAMYTAIAPHPFYADKLARFKSFMEYDQKIIITELDDFVVIHERHIGNYNELGKNWLEFTEKYHDCIKDDTLLIERFYDDPSITSVKQCLYELCMTVDQNCPLDNVIIIPGGGFAKFRFEGLIQDIFAAFQGVFTVWLPESGYEMRESYGLDIYRAIDRESMRVVMDLCIPIK
ncbi:DNA-binding domain-containing protein, AraC-type [Desulfosporosinus orientis DSM 765]|uniref:DNA-binding domain-containing protein, AraC-type n=1 Tax=Desulfosporosinus orientis (strain ATCC 19365 / DSM 765 / NCIMB 8382 / VKM B-1628 / Singapore I) TaxID=768706 RepID=G7WGK4_DESOD|nr:DNA-binding domain-containing protein, AraC-type [Desulfosporosinus orientis DSM 765]